MYLLDTNVVSELRKAKTGKANAEVVAWSSTAPAQTMFLSVISILEIELGILLIERKDHTQGGRLRSWLEGQLLGAFDGRVLPVDIDIARRCAELHVPDPRSERDAIIAATALVHDMTVVTRNISDFNSTEVRLLNPWESRPPQNNDN